MFEGGPSFRASDRRFRRRKKMQGGELTPRPSEGGGAPHRGTAGASDLGAVAELGVVADPMAEADGGDEADRMDLGGTEAVGEAGRRLLAGKGRGETPPAG